MAIPDLVPSKVNTGLPSSDPRSQNLLVLKENGGLYSIGLHMKTVQGQLTVVPKEQKEIKQDYPRQVFQWKQRVRPEPADTAVETKVPVQHFVNLFIDVLEYILLAGHLILHVSFDVHGLKRSSVCPKYL